MLNTNLLIKEATVHIISVITIWELFNNSF
jgi:hypothetical protein